MADNQEQLFNEFADLAALEAQQKKILDIFEKVKTGILDLNKSGIKIDSASGQRGLGDALKNQKKQQDELTLSINEYNKLLSQRAILEAKLNASGSEQAKSLNERKLALKEINKEQQLRIRLSKAEEGSIDQLSLKYQKVTGIISKLSKEQRESARGQSLVAFAGKTQEELKKLDAQVGSFRRNVGNYANSLAGGFEAVRREIARLERQKSAFEIGGDTRGAEAAARQISELNNIQKIGLNTNNSFTQTVRQLEREYQNLASSGTATNEFLEEFKKFVADAKDQAGDLKAEIKALSSDTRAFDLVAGSISTIASGFEAASGAAALFGADTEDVQKSIQKLVAIQSVANGIRDIATQVTTKGTAANKAYAFAQEQITILTSASTSATQKWGAALKTVGVGLIIAGVIKLAETLGIFGGVSKEAKERTDELTKSLEAQKRAIDGINESYDFNIELLKNRLKQQGKTESEINKAIIEERKVQLEDAIVIEEQAKNKRLKIEQEFQSKLEQARKKAKELGFNGPITIGEDEKKELDEQTKLINQQVIEATANRTKLENQITLLGEEEKTRIAEEGFDKRKELQDKAIEDAKKRTEAEKKAALELLKFRQELVAEEKNIIADDDLFSTTDKRIQAAKDAAAAQRIIIRAEKNYELEQEGFTASQILLIREKAQKSITDIEINLAKKITEIRIQALQQQTAGVDAGNSFYEQLAQKNLEAFEKTQNELSILRDRDLQNANENYQKGLKTLDQFNERKKQIEFDYQAAVIKSQITFYKQQLDESNLTDAQKLSFKAQIAQAEVALSNLVTENKISNDEKEKKSTEEKYKKLQEDLAKVKDIYSQFADAVGGIIDAIATAQLNGIQAQLDAVDKLKAAEIDRINKSTDSEEKKAARIKIVEARAQNDREALERRQRQVKRQQAIFDKANNIANIILNTAEAVTKWLAKGNIGLSIAAGVIGAAQLAIAIATPIPQFAKGKKAGEYEGYGIVGEAGREIAIDEKGKVTMYEKPTLTYLSRGTTILPNQVTEDILNANNMALAAAFKYDGRVKQDPLNNHMIQMYEEQISLLREIKNKEMTVYNHVHNDANWNSYIEQHVKR